MVDDISTLGIGVDSSGVRRATDDMQGMAAQGRNAASGATELEGAMTRATLKGTLFERAISNITTTAIRAAEAWIKLGLAVGDYQDIADTTQADPAGLASMQTAADVAGVSIASVGQAMNRMQLILSRVKDEASPAARALRSIGLEFEAFKRLSPDQQYRAVAQALDGYADKQGKVAVAQTLFGRGGAEQLKLLKELGGETERSNLLTNAQIAYADELADSMKRSASQTRQMAAALAVSALPALEGLVTAGKEAFMAMVGIDKGATDLTKNKKIEEWSDAVAAALGFIVDAGDGVGRIFRIIGTDIGASAAMVSALLERDFKRAGEIARMAREDIDGILNEGLFSDRLAKAIAAARAKARAAGTSGSDKPEINFRVAGDPNDKQRKDVYETQLALVEKKLALETQELDAGRELTASEKLRLEVYEKLNAARRALTEAEADALENAIEEYGIRERANAQRKEDQKWLEESAKLTEQTINNARQRADATRQMADALKEEADRFGISEEQLKSLEAVRLRDAAAQLRAKRVVDDFAPGLQEYNRLLEEQAAALDDAADSRERLNELEIRAKRDPFDGIVRAVQGYAQSVQDLGTETEKVASNAANQLEDELSRTLGRGRADFRATIDYMIQEALRLNIIKPVLNQLFSLGLQLFSPGLTVDTTGIGINNTGTSLPTAGGKAGGGHVRPGSAQPVAERGPEIFTDSSGNATLLTGARGGTVTPSDKIGGSTYNITSAPVIRIDARSDQAQVAGLVGRAIGESNRQLIAELKAMGKV